VARNKERAPPFSAVAKRGLSLADDSKPRKPRLLVIPHIYAENIRIRDIEFARNMGDSFDVYCLKWSDATNVDDRRPFRRRLKQFSAGIRSIIKSSSTSKDNSGITLVELPILQPILLRRIVGDDRALSIARALNTRRLMKLISRLGISHVLSANVFFDLPSTSGLRTFYDVVDWYPEETSTSRQLQTARTHMTRIRDQFTGVFAVSEMLADKLKSDYGLNSIFIPNGADLDTLRKISQSEVESVRNRWGLKDKYVIGYAGNHGSFTGVDFVVEVYRIVRQRIPNAVLLIIGPADYWLNKIGDHTPGVIFTGAIPPAKMAAYYQALDLGVLAKEKTLGTEFMFPLKIVEYTACRKFVISTPLLTLQRLNWPNVWLRDLDVNTWANAICELKDQKWLPEWDALTAAFDWKLLSHKMAVTMLGENPREPHRG
jgi:glycosyltransferase involved in cell wall biosynthesis